MYAVQGAPGEAESVPFEGKRVFVFNTTWLVWLVVAAYFGVIIYWIWSDEESKLYRLHKMTQFWQSIARFAGQRALQSEHDYFDYAELFH